MNVAKQIKKSVYVVGQDGLWAVDPYSGKLSQVFKSKDWYDRKNPIRRYGGQEQLPSRANYEGPTRVAVRSHPIRSFGWARPP